MTKFIYKEITHEVLIKCTCSEVPNYPSSQRKYYFSSEDLAEDFIGSVRDSSPDTYYWSRYECALSKYKQPKLSDGELHESNPLNPICNFPGW
jgi:hypothetical protein